MRPAQRVAYAAITLVVIAALVNFSLYFWAPEQLATNFGPEPTVVDYVLRAMLFITLAHVVAMNLLTWVGAGLLLIRPRPRVQELPDPATTKVALITTFVPGSEPLEMLAQTLKAMTQADYPHDTWVLDEGDDEGAKRVCRLLGVKHFSRKGIEAYNTVGGTFSMKTKGGNHNAWYDAHGLEYDFVAQIDTDFIPRKDFLTKTLVHFAEPRIGWVGTPQIYGNEESFIARGANEQTYGFYGIMLRGLARIESTLMIGANHVVRVEALRQSGLYAAHLVEDLATGMKLHAEGWRSVYVAEPLLIGEGPTDWTSYFKQQFRWAKGSIDYGITRAWKLIPRMRPLPAFLYTWLMLFYYNGAAFGLGVLLLVLHLVFGLDAISVELVPFLLAYLPFILGAEAALFWSQRLHTRPEREKGLLLACRVLTVATMPVYLAAFLSAIRDLGKHTEFEVTQKGAGGPAGGGSGGSSTSKEAPVKTKRKSPVDRPHQVVAGLAVVAGGVGLALGNADPTSMIWILGSSVPFGIALTRPAWHIVKFPVVRMSREHRLVQASLEESLDVLALTLEMERVAWPTHSDPAFIARQQTLVRTDLVREIALRQIIARGYPIEALRAELEEFATPA